ncbi:MAG: hypothetical protein JRJ84_23120, partial [Deltaproteobacteria bacterium]|nr:hypothetical protein [Deltaproteobacteria bacterium]
MRGPPMWMLPLVLVGCGSPWVEEVEDGLRHLMDGRTSRGRNGLLKIKVEVDEGETGMLITADPLSPNRAVFLNLTDPDGEVRYDLDTEWDSGR